MCFKRLFLLSFIFSLFSTASFSQKVELKETPKGIDFLIDNQRVLTYQTATADVPEGVKQDFKKNQASSIPLPHRVARY